MKRRIDIISSLQDKPFVYIINIQVPGDPPVSFVLYFAIPRYFHKDLAQSEILQKAKKTFEKFIDIPYASSLVDADVAVPDHTPKYDDRSSNKSEDIPLDSTVSSKEVSANYLITDHSRKSDSLATENSKPEKGSLLS